jgi:hypothetical protein
MSAEKEGRDRHGGTTDPPRWMMAMHMSSIKFLALVVLAAVVLLTAAEFGPTVLSGISPGR